MRLARTERIPTGGGTGIVTLGPFPPGTFVDNVIVQVYLNAAVFADAVTIRAALFNEPPTTSGMFGAGEHVSYTLSLGSRTDVPTAPAVIPIKEELEARLRFVSVEVVTPASAGDADVLVTVVVRQARTHRD